MSAATEVERCVIEVLEGLIDDEALDPGTWRAVADRLSELARSCTRRAERLEDRQRWADQPSLWVDVETHGRL